MGTYIVSNLISIDGRASGPGGDVMALPFDAGFSEHNLELMERADTIVSGATTFRGLVDYWPSIEDDAAQPEVERAIARRHRALGQLVVSDSVSPAEAGPWREHTTIVPRAEAVAAVTRAKEQGRTLLTFGSLTLVDHLAAAGVVDELHVLVGAGVVPGGVPVLTVQPPGTMDLVDVERLAGSNLVRLVYALG